MPETSTIGRTIRLLRTLSHLKPWQVGGRVASQIRRRLPVRSLPVPDALSTPVSGTSRIDWPAHDPWNTRSDLLEGRFRFLNRTEQLGWTPDWSAPRTPLLWQFNLHYFHYLHLLEPSESVELCRSWISANTPGSVGWHPYPTSLRIVNWCRSALEESDVLESLYLQAAHLYRNVETYVYGNHLLENARALIHAGTFFKGLGEANAWTERGLEIFRDQTKEQILPDGGHFERSPMYHALMLEGYADVLNLLPNDHPDRAWLTVTVRKMLGFLRATIHPDGHLALFNDSTQEIALSPRVLEAYAVAMAGSGDEPRFDYPDTGYYLYRDSDLYLVIDAGPGGPDYLMAHAHADVFSFELSISGKQFVTDTGVFEYAPGEMRDYVRSTRAHNTVCVDGVDQIECWGSFRVGRRAAPDSIEFRRDARGMSFAGTFRGYADAIGYEIVHRRVIAVDAEARTITIEDEITGRGSHLIEGRLHLHPDVSYSDENGQLSHSAGVRGTIEVKGAPFRQESGWYCPGFGIRRERTVLVTGGRGDLPRKWSVVLRY